MELNFDCAVLTAAQIHAADARAAQMGIRPYDLMQRAGSALATSILQRFPKSRALILCGPGNNGGDGFAIARKLSNMDKDVKIITIGNLDKMSHCAKINFDICTNMGIDHIHIDSLDKRKEEILKVLKSTDQVID